MLKFGRQNEILQYIILQTTTNSLKHNDLYLNLVARMTSYNTYTNSHKQSQTSWPVLKLGGQNEILQHIYKQPQTVSKEYLNLAPE